jgi:tyrosine-specific transport protein
MMIGAIVGVGVFGLPYVFAQAGFALALIELFVIGVLLTLLQLMQAEVAIQTNGHHRLAGYVRMYLGEGWSWIAVIALAGGIWGAMIAYMIVGGNFLFLFLSPLMGGTEFFYALLLAGVASLLIYRGLRFASKFEMVIVGALLFLFVFIILASLPHIRPNAYLPISLEQAFLPYGVILFSLAGVGVVPELKDVLGTRLQSKLGHVILIGMTVILVLYAAFSAAVLGVTGTETTPVAFDGLIPVLGGTFRYVATFLGSLTILSIYFMLGIELLNTLRFDFRLSHRISWLIVVAVPIVFYLSGAREFINVIGFVGSIFAGALGILVALTYLRMKRSPTCEKHQCLNFPNRLTWTLILLFVGGIIFELFVVK